MTTDKSGDEKIIAVPTQAHPLLREIPTITDLPEILSSASSTSSQHYKDYEPGKGGQGEGMAGRARFRDG